MKSCKAEAYLRISIIGKTPRSTTVIAAGKVLALGVDASFLERIDEDERAASHAIIYKMLATILAERLRTANNKIAELETQRISKE